MKPTNTIPNARFWHYGKAGWVKLTLTPGQRLEHYCSAPDDEGFSYEGNTWRHQGNMVLNQWGNGGRDCDGRIDRSGESICMLSELREPCPDWILKDYPREFNPPRPNWREHSPVRIRDEYAQLANY